MRFGSSLAEADQEVILSAGAYGSPQILMLSGIGEDAHLREHGIDVQISLPGVGRGLEDHLAVAIQHRCLKPVSPARRLGPVGRIGVGLEWLLFRSGLGASNYFEVGTFFRSAADAPCPDLQHEFLPMLGEFHRGKATVSHGFQYFLSLMHPLSQGRMLLGSRDPRANPVIRFNYLSHPEECRQLIAGIRLTRDIIRQKGWDTLRGDEVAPGPDIQSDGDLEAWIRSEGGTGYHAACTCRMGSDDLAVTDEEGWVHGTEGLRVVDASLFPKMITGNTNAATIMIAEKFADRIRGRDPLPAEETPFYWAKAESQAQDQDITC